MPRKSFLPAEVHRTSARIADGRLKYYFALRGRKRTGFWSDFDPNPRSPEFFAAYSRAMQDAQPKQEVTSTADVVADFYASARFKKKGDRTKADYKRWLDRFVEEFGEDPIKMWGIKESRREIEKWRKRWVHTRPLSIHDKGPDYEGRKVRLHRVFNRGNFDHGGRFYGGWWQVIKKHARPKITLDGQHTIEADFRGFNPAVLLAEAGQLIPDDPYSPIVGANAPDDLRDHAKSTLAALLNSKTGTTEEPRYFDRARWGMTAEDFRAKVLDAFPMVLAMLGTDKGLTLQRLESDIAEAVMLHFVRQGHAILPIHDAFIVQAHLEQELVQVMKDTFKARLGQVPHVKVTRSYALR